MNRCEIRHSDPLNPLPKLPQEVKMLILCHILNQTGCVHFVNTEYRKNYLNTLQAKTDDKTGLYGKSLILEGVLLIQEAHLLSKKIKVVKIEIDEKLDQISEQKCELLKIRNMGLDRINKEVWKNKTANINWMGSVQTLFVNALFHPEGKSRMVLDGMCSFSHSAIEAIDQINNLFRLEIEHAQVHMQYLDDITILELTTHAHMRIINTLNAQLNAKNACLEKLRVMRDVENSMFNLLGGEADFNRLKVLVLNHANKSSWTKGTGYIDAIKKLPLGQSVMRGIDPQCRPFIAISYIDSRDNDLMTAVFHQRYPDQPNNWVPAGDGVTLLRNYGDLGHFMDSSAKERRLIEIPFKQLLNTGSCKVYPDSDEELYRLMAASSDNQEL
jgi:hypothetical protein